MSFCPCGPLHITSGRHRIFWWILSTLHSANRNCTKLVFTQILSNQELWRHKQYFTISATAAVIGWVRVAVSYDNIYSGCDSLRACVVVSYDIYSGCGWLSGRHYGAFMRSRRQLLPSGEWVCTCVSIKSVSDCLINIFYVEWTKEWITSIFKTLY